MVLQLTFPCKSFFTERTCEWEISSVFEHVILQMAIGGVCRITKGAFVQLHTISLIKKVLKYS